MVFTEVVLYLDFKSEKLEVLFLTTCVSYYLDSTLEIYFNNFFEVAHKNEKNI